MPNSRAHILSSLFAILYFTASTSAETRILPTRDTTIGRLVLQIARESVTVSPDQEHLAFVSKWGDPSLADKGISPDKPVNEDHPPSEIRPSDKIKPELVVYRDDKNGPHFQFITAPVFSPDSQHLAYAGQKADETWHVLLDGKEIMTAEGLTTIPFAFSPDSQHHAIAYNQGIKWRVKFDDTDGPAFEGIGAAPILFSPDSKHIAYVGRLEKMWRPVVDGKAGASYDRLSAFGWLPDSSGIAFTAALKDKRWQVFAPGFTSKEYEFVLKGPPIFSPDSKRIAFGTMALKVWQVISTDGESPKLDQVSPDSIAFIRKPDGGSRLIYFGLQGKTWRLFEEHNPTDIVFENIIVDTFRISPDGLHYAVAGYRGGKAVLLRDGQSLGEFEIVGGGTLAFSPDSKHLACAASRDQNWYIVVDGNPVTPAGLIKGVAAQPIAFSPDGQRIAYQALDNSNNWHLYLGPDQTWLSGIYRNFFGQARVNWRSDGRVVTIAIQKALAVRVESDAPK